MRYQQFEVALDPSQEDRLKGAIQLCKQISLRIYPHQGDKKLLLFTPAQIEKVERAKILGKPVVGIKLSKAQVKANTEHVGGFLWGLASALGPLLLQGAKALAPAIIRGAASAVASKGVEKMMGKGLYYQKNGHSVKVQPMGRGLFLNPSPYIKGGEGVFESNDGVTPGGSGLLLGPNSPFKSIPLLNILL